MRSEIRAGEVTILRPFLDLPRSRLRATAEAAGLSPVEDAMNADPRFARARMRKLMPLLAAEGVDAAGLAATARRLAGAAEAVDAGAGGLLRTAVTLNEFATATLAASLFFTAPAEIRSRALVRLLLAIGGDPYPPRYERLAALLRDMEMHGGGTRFKRTLAGTVIEFRRGSFVLYREIGRAGLPDIAVGAGYSAIWDNRFHVEVGKRAPRGLRLAALGEEGRRAAGIRVETAPTGAVEALPAFWRKATLLAVPTIGHFHEVSGDFSVKVRPVLAPRLAEPPRFPDFLASR